MKFNIFNSLILAGAIQGIVFAAIVLLSGKYRNRSVYFLTSLIFSFSLSIFQYYLSDTRLVSFQTLYDTIFMPFAPLNPVLFYLYVFTFLYSDRKISNKQKLLFIPFAFFLLISIIFKLIVLFDLDSDALRHFFWKLFGFHEVFSLIYTIWLGVLSYKLILLYETKEKLRKPYYKTHLNWLKNTLIIGGVLCIFWAYLTYEFFAGKQTSYYFLWIGMSFTIYWLGHIGVYKYGIDRERKNIRNHGITHIKQSIIIKPKGKNEHISKMEDLVVNKKYYRNSELTLETIANELNINKSHLSRLINAELNTGFIDYVNKFRVEEAKFHLTNPEFSNYTFVSIGLESGFNSKSTFNNAFKKYTGMTPSEYKKNFKESTS
ncbi:MAG: helix-turn-helix transcriptional regulator [Flavobacteriaceae bacterium]|nr:helix-turn-helix transcriptional regulator [Flavobacteriaceae bacterium]